MTERRRFYRLPYNVPMTVTRIVTSQGEQIEKLYELTLRDVSAGGLSFVCKFPIPPGTRMDIAFALGDHRVACQVEVVRAEQAVDQDGYHIGGRFVDLTAVQERQLVRWITRASARQQYGGTFHAGESALRLGNLPANCFTCRCRDCDSRSCCRPCRGSGCGRRFCWRYVPSWQNVKLK